MTKPIFALTAFLAMGAWPIACGSDDPPPPPPPEQAGQACTAPEQCYPDTHDAGLQGGAAVCLDRVPGGYCTHVCGMNTDCCAVPGECRTSYPQVCSPFESAADKYCFLSCDDSVLGDAGIPDGDSFCAKYAWAGFKCRASGGGNPHKVCTP
jgi:hypothetical protein